MKIRDLHSCRFPVLKKNAQELLSDAEPNKPQGLKVTMRATCSGFLVNNRVYPGRIMKNSYKSFFSEEHGGTGAYDKPVLLHHKSGMGMFSEPSDPVGRVTGGKFVALKTGTDFSKDYVAPDTRKSGGLGSGIVVLDALITDLSAIQKILNEQYTTVSTSCIPEDMVCSICGKSFVHPAKDDEPCEHWPGETYKDDGKLKLCYGIVAGSMEYVEVSFVNVPAQPNAKIIKYSFADAIEDDSKELIEISAPGAINELLLICKNGELISLVADDAAGEVTVTDKKAATDKTVVAVGEKFIDPLPEEDVEKTSSAPTQVPEPVPAKVVDDVVAADKPVPAPIPGSVAAPTEPSTKDILEASLGALTRENKTLGKAIETHLAEVERQKLLLVEKDAEIVRLRKDGDSLRSQMARVLAEAVLNAKILLRKPDTEMVKNKETYQTALEALATRTSDSLRDSLSDLTMELNNLKETKLANAVRDTKVADPRFQGKPAAPKKATPADDLDELLK